MKRIVVSKNDSSQRVDKFLTKSFPKLPKSLMYKAIRKKDIKINGKRCEVSTILEMDDVLTIYIKDELLEANPYKADFLSARKELKILYEDDNILIIDKEPELLVHDDKDNHDDTLISRIHRYLYDKGEYNPSSDFSFSPSLINRIDRNTGGIVMAAKNSEALRIMNMKLRNHEIDKFYLCVVDGIMEEKSKKLTSFIEKDHKKNKVKLSKKENENTKPIETQYRVLDEKENYSLLEVQLITGRTHQIRAQFAALGHPLIGDHKYGASQSNSSQNFPYQALYSYKVFFNFITDAGVLEYLNHKEFVASDIWFMKKYDKFK